MLEAVTLYGEPTSLPTLCEALVYYRNVHIAGHPGVFLKAISDLGEDNFLRLLDRDALRLDLAKWNYGVMGDRAFPATCQLIEMRLGKDEDESFHDTITLAERNPNRNGVRISAKTLQIIADRITDLGRPPSVLQSARIELSDPLATTRLVADVIDTLVPGYRLPPNFYAKCFVFENDVGLVTNLDYNDVNRAYHARVPVLEGGVINQARLMVAASAPHALMYYVGDSGSDLWVDDLSARLLRTKVESYARRLSQADRSISHFEDIMFQGKSFKDVIKSGDRTVSELLNLLEKENTIQFKKLIAEAKSGSDLIREYERALLAEPAWLRSAPAKAVKLALFTGISIASGGIHGAIAAAVPGAVASTVDEFAISKIKLGWKPNQWVDRTAKPFLFGN